LHDALPICRKREDAIQLRQPRGGILLVVHARDQRFVADVELLAHFAHGRGGALEIAELLEHQLDYLEPPVAMLEIVRSKERRLIMAVRAPASSERDDHDLAGEAWIAQGDGLAVQIGKREVERLCITT